MSGDFGKPLLVVVFLGLLYRGTRLVVSRLVTVKQEIRDELGEWAMGNLVVGIVCLIYLAMYRFIFFDAIPPGEPSRGFWTRSLYQTGLYGLLGVFLNTVVRWTKCLPLSKV